MAPLLGASGDGSGLGRHSALPHTHVSEGLYIKTTDISAHARGAAGVSLPTQRRASCSQLPFPGHNSHFPHVKNEPSTDTQHMPRGWQHPAPRLALGPTAGHHSEVGHEGSVTAPPALCIEGVRACQGRGCTSSLSQEPLQQGHGAGTILHVPGRRVAPLTLTSTKVMPREPTKVWTPLAGGCWHRVWVPGSGHAHTDTTDPAEAQQSRGSHW